MATNSVSLGCSAADNANDDHFFCMPANSALSGVFKAAAQDLGQGKIDMLVTAPIDKHSMQAAGFEFPGHTEYLSHLAGSDSPVLMILVGEGLRVALVTGHLPINQVAEAVTVERILIKARLFHKSLQSDFGVMAPRINPKTMSFVGCTK